MMRGRTGLAIAGLLILVVLIGAGNLWASYAIAQNTNAKFEAAQATAEKAGAKEVQALCADLSTMAAIQPPAGSPVANPSRAYEQAEHRAWVGLATSIRCGG